MPRREQRLKREAWLAREDVQAARAAGLCGERAGKSTGNPHPCKRPRSPNGKPCRLHGGMANGPPWKHGRYSKELEVFRDAIRQRALSPSLLDAELLQKIALLDEAEDALLERGLTQQDTPEFRKRALDLFKSARGSVLEAGGSWDPALDDLGKLLEEGYARDRVLAEAADVAERRAKRTVEVRRVIAQESQAGDLLRDKLSAVVSVVFTVLVDDLGAQRAQPLIDRTLNVLAGRGKLPVIDAEVAT